MGSQYLFDYKGYSIMRHGKIFYFSMSLVEKFWGGIGIENVCMGGPVRKNCSGFSEKVVG